MIGELGHVALIVALALACVQTVLGILGAGRADPGMLAGVRMAVTGQAVFIALSFALLAAAFLRDDFSLLYVAQHSNTELPSIYKFTAIWGAHEGSMVLWVLVLALWTLAVAFLSGPLPDRFVGRVLGVMGAVSVGFLIFVLFTSNPFERLLPAAAEGRDLNPLLQDPGMVMHPPLLYIGYVGFSVAFSFAVAALLEGRVDARWTRWCRPWTVAAWAFLTVGIALGSWWAYYELGWGGWWFWDPVENASFMPWLVGTALIHSLAVTEQRAAFRSWTLLLAIFAFGLSLLGTFLVRSGVLISVHSFASDPTRGLFILLFLGIVVGSALALYAWRAPRMAGGEGFRLHSKEAFLLMNNLLLVVTAAAILWGTLYPLLLDALGVGKISVGPPWFDAVFGSLMLPLVLLLGIGPYVRWKRSDGSEYLRASLPAAIAAVVLGISVPWLAWGSPSLGAVAGGVAGFWVLLTALREPWTRLRKGRRVPARIAGMTLAHLGVGLFVLGVAWTSSYSIERDAGLTPGESVQAGPYSFRLDGTREVAGPNYEAIEGKISVFREGEPVTVLYPQKRIYRVQRSPMTEAGIHGRLDRDLFVALGEPLGQRSSADGPAEAWSIRVRVKPVLRFVWLGALIMSLGGLVALSDRRYREQGGRNEEMASSRLGTDEAEART